MNLNCGCTVRAQVNGQLMRGEKYGMDNWFPNVRDGVFVPIAWFDEVSEVTDSGVSEFKVLYYAADVRVAFFVIGAVFTAIFALPLLAAARVHWLHRRRQKSAAFSRADRDDNSQQQIL